MFANTRISTLLSWGFGIVILLIVIMAAMTYQRSNKVAVHVAEVTGDAYPKVTAASEIRKSVLRNWSNTLLLLIITDATESKRIKDEMVANSKVITDKFEFLDKATVTEAGKQHLAAMLQARADYTEHRKQYLELVKSANKEEANHFLSGTLQAKLEAYAQAIGGLIEYQSAQMEGV
jgi:methyl-accepting chemotaxis protein